LSLYGEKTDTGKWFRCWNCGFRCNIDRDVLSASYNNGISYYIAPNLNESSIISFDGGVSLDRGISTYSSYDEPLVPDDYYSNYIELLDNGYEWNISIDDLGVIYTQLIGSGYLGPDRLLKFLSPNGVTWNVTISNTGVISTYTITPHLYLQSPDSNIWEITVDNNGVLITTVVVGTASTTFTFLTPNGTLCDLSIDNNGVLNTTIPGSGIYVSKVILLSSGGVSWAVEVDNNGILNTVNVSAVSVTGVAQTVISLMSDTGSTAWDLAINNSGVLYTTDVDKTARYYSIIGYTGSSKPSYISDFSERHNVVPDINSGCPFCGTLNWK
jgi:hypothetical protein